MPDMQDSIKSILNRAIRFEEDSYNLYNSALEQVKNAADQGVAEGAGRLGADAQGQARGPAQGRPELGHPQVAAAKQVADLKIGDYLVAAPLGEKSDFQDVLLVAMKREQAAHDFYASMAASGGRGHGCRTCSSCWPKKR